LPAAGFEPAFGSTKEEPLEKRLQATLPALHEHLFVLEVAL
jgi:hypothetical protein